MNKIQLDDVSCINKITKFLRKKEKLTLKSKSRVQLEKTRAITVTKNCSFPVGSINKWKACCSKSNRMRHTCYTVLFGSAANWRILFSLFSTLRGSSMRSKHDAYRSGEWTEMVRISWPVRGTRCTGVPTRHDAALNGRRRLVASRPGRTRPCTLFHALLPCRERILLPPRRDACALEGTQVGAATPEPPFLYHARTSSHLRRFNSPGNWMDDVGRGVWVHRRLHWRAATCKLHGELT